jgi:hypothetical protein
MPTSTQYRVVSAGSPVELQKELNGITADGFKPILLTSAANNTGLIVITVIVERTTGV